MPALSPERRSLLSICLTLALWFAGYSVSYSQTLGTLFENGPTDRRLNIVLISEGYTQSELLGFPDKADDIVNHMFSEDPFVSYKSFFNAYTLSIPSAESGADEPSNSIEVDTAFDATFGARGIDRLLTVNSSKVRNALLEHFPEYDIVLIVVNSERYGGSGGTYAVTSTNSSAFEIAVHEIGHSFGGLEDEYSTESDIEPRESVNITANTNRETIKWKHWIEESTPVPTINAAQYQNDVGLFEGAMYTPAGWYRPHQSSKMRTLNSPWGQVNVEQLIISAYQDLPITTGFSPSESEISIQLPGTIRFEAISPLPQIENKLAYEWSIDGERISFEGPAFSLDPYILENGTHTVKLLAIDRTALVRSDPNRLLQTANVWNLDINLSPIPISYEIWSIRNIEALTERAANLDIDHDGYTNLEEFFLGSDPLVRNDESHSITFGFDDETLLVEIQREVKNHNATAIVESAWIGDDWIELVSIQNDSIENTSAAQVEIDPESNSILIRDTSTLISEEPHRGRVMRLRYNAN